jgi:ATP-dependent DNA helicase PIF1
VRSPVLLSRCTCPIADPSHYPLPSSPPVMLIKNIDETLVNGSVGRVLSFQTVDGYQAYKRSLLVNGTSETADVDEKAKEKPAAGKNEMMLPIVEFAIPGGGKREYQVVQEKFSVEAPNGEIQASRTQIPLVLAWAMRFVSSLLISLSLVQCVNDC